MKRVLFAIFLTLSACSFTQGEKPFIPTLQLPDAPPLDLKPVEFTIQSGNVCMDPESYKNLSENTEMIRQWMILQREITGQYRVFYEAPLLEK